MFIEASARATSSTVVIAGTVALPGGDAAEPFIDADDIADVAVAALIEYGLPDDMIWLLRYSSPPCSTGRNARLANGVQRTLGREPNDFADCARETAATGVWRPQP